MKNNTRIVVHVVAGAVLSSVGMALMDNVSTWFFPVVIAGYFALFASGYHFRKLED